VFKDDITQQKQLKLKGDITPYWFFTVSVLLSLNIVLNC